MYNRIGRAVSVALCFALILGACVFCIPALDVSAATYRPASNSAHSSYLGSKYYEHYSKIEITGDGRTDVVAVALSQLGYQESPTEYDFDGIGGGSGNNTEFNYNMGDFGVGYGGGNYDWCASFVAWALYQSYCTDQNSMSDWCRKHDGINGTYDKEYIWREVGCGHWANQLRRSGYFERSYAYNGNTYKPQSGDLIFFCWDGPSGGEDHIGIVVYSDNSYVYTVEGNTSNYNGLEDDGGGVYFKRYALTYEYITGYGVLPYKTNSEVEKIDYSGANATPGDYICNESKAIYNTEASDSAAYYSERFSMFEVVGVAANGRLRVKGIKTTTGAVVDGYINNDSARVLQLSSTPYSPAERLDAALERARVARYDHYTESDLTALRKAYDEALEVANKATATDAQKLKAAEKLEDAIASTVSSKEEIVSLGKSYTAPASGRTDSFVDDGTRLTDGKKTDTDGNKNTFAGFNTQKPIDIVIDLGGSVKTNVYRAYSASMADWGIGVPVSMTVAVSKDGKTYEELGTTEVKVTTYKSEKWNMYTFTIEADTVRTERYVKISVERGSNHVWLQEVEAAYSPESASGRSYISGINKRITAGDTVIFTSDLGKLEPSEYNFRYTRNVIATWNGTSYVISSITMGSGDNTPAITLTEGQILIASHDWEEGADDPVIGSHANALIFANAKIGDELELVGIDIENKSLSAAPTVAIKKGEVEYILGDINSDGKINEYDYVLVARHHFATRILTDDEYIRADVDKNGTVDQYDYLLIARHYFGTYVIK
ncbi:MAG: CHAP domain-containing protein [Clostridia bacterium]|nr:CHAP domain-containing protein [Clostridia bacterium]